MRVRYAVSDKLSIEFDAQGQKEVFKALSLLEEVFTQDTCGVCESTKTRFAHRLSQDGKYNFYEMVCTECGARLQFGQSRDEVSLFPRRKDKNGVAIGVDGWAKYQSHQREPAQEEPF